MRNISFVLLVIALFSAGCKHTPKDELAVKPSVWQFDTLKVQKELFVNNDSTKAGMKLSLEFIYPGKFSNDSILGDIQNIFVEAFTNEKKKNLTPKEAFTDFVKKCTDDGLELGRYAADDGPDYSSYFKNVKTSVADTTSITITAKTRMEDYTGGAHGSHWTAYYTVDTRNGSLLTEDNLFQKGYKDQLLPLLKDLLTNTRNSQGETITILDAEAITLNGNFYFTDKGMVYVFNEYEIAPYSDGLIEVTIPYEKLEPLFQPQYDLLIAIKTKVVDGSKIK